jgi:hypothetical protein
MAFLMASLREEDFRKALASGSPGSFWQLQVLVDLNICVDLHIEKLRAE